MKDIKDFIVNESTEKTNALYYGKVGMNGAPSTEGTKIYIDPNADFLEIWFNQDTKSIESISVKSMDDINDYKKYPTDEEYDYDALINGISKLKKLGDSFTTYDDVVYVKIK